MDLDDEFEAMMRQANPHVPETSAQYRESRRLFFAGAAAIFVHLLEIAERNPKAAQAGVADLEEQLKEFFTQRVADDKD